MEPRTRDIAFREGMVQRILAGVAPHLLEGGILPDEDAAGIRIRTFFHDIPEQGVRHRCRHWKDDFVIGLVLYDTYGHIIPVDVIYCEPEDV